MLTDKSRRRAEHCLFCSNPTIGEGFASKEHVIPGSMGGTLLTRDVCKPCNGYFGCAVDCVADAPLLIRLRCEAGLAPRRRLLGEYYDEYLGVSLPAWQDSNNTVVPVRPVQRERAGNTVIISGASRSSAEREMRREEERLRNEGLGFAPEPIVQIHERQVPFQSVEAQESVQTLRSLLGREAAKIAIELIGLRASAKVASDAALDPVRDYARHGSPLDGVTIAVLGPERLWLPRAKLLLRFGPEPAPPEGAVPNLPDPTVPTMQPPGVPQLMDVVHVLGFHRDHDGGHFVLLLFGVVRIHVPLPEHLPLPWKRVEYYDLLRGRSLVRYS